jgi:hypothetical protein
MTSKAYKTALSEWASYAKQELDSQITTLIAQANYDLYYGPCEDEDYPGFSTAVRLISDAISVSVFNAVISVDGCDEDVEIAPRDAKIALVGRELAQYV